MPRRENRTNRRAPHRPSRPLVLVICGGDVTEPAYLRGLRDTVDTRAVDIRLLPRGTRSPADLVAFAITQRGADFDEVWCVFDVDQFPVAEAVRRAAKADIGLAVSTPCFELWLLLHHADHRSHLADCRATATLLSRQLPRYDKTRLRFADFAAGVQDAIHRAVRLDPTGNDHERNPSTSMWRLAKKIMGVDDE